jgi:hypothetical protein
VYKSSLLLSGYSFEYFVFGIVKQQLDIRPCDKVEDISRVRVKKGNIKKQHN